MLGDVIGHGAKLPAVQPIPTDDVDPLTLLVYTSGSTGAPKGAIYTERMVADSWGRSATGRFGDDGEEPAITLNFMPMSHVMGRGVLYSTLRVGGTAYFAARSDLSTFLEDLALVRPTQLSFVPRIWDMIFAEVQRELDRRPDDRAAVLSDARLRLLGGRYVTAMTGSAPMSPEMTAFVEELLDIHLVDGYGSTEAGAIMVDGRLQRPPVIDYRLVDVPDLGYFRTDRPHPRGELLVKSAGLFPGYYKRPELTAEMFDDDGYYRTGDVVAETGPDQLVYLDRRNNVLKLSQGEFVTVSKLEAAFGDSPLVRQIYVYGNSARSYLLAVVVPTDDALAQYDTAELKSVIGESLSDVAKAAGLQSYEIPRDVLIETTPFTLENGMLTGIRKLARPKLKERYGESLEQLYAELAEGQADELRALRQGDVDGPVLPTVIRAAGALLGAGAADVRADAHFTDLGGDSLSALTFANLLHEIFEIDVPVGVIVSPAKRSGGTRRLHRGRTPTRRQASDVRIGARPRRDRGTRERSDAGQVHRRADARRGCVTAGSEHRGPHGVAHRSHRIPRPLSRTRMAAADGSRWRQGDLPGPREGRRRRPRTARRRLRQRRSRTAAALPPTCRRTPRGDRGRQG